MPYKIFRVPSRGCEQSEHDLNNFLGSHKILSVSREFVGAGENSFWCFCIDYLELGSSSTGNQSGRRRNKIDYREVLDPEDFALFAKLRELRKAISQGEAIPVFAIFTNEQLAQIVRQRITTKEALRAIPGLGDARVAKYGERVIEVSIDHWKAPNEESEPTV